MKTMRLAVAIALVVAPVSIPAQTWGPNGNGTLEHEDDLKWVFFNDAKVTADNKRGVYIAKFSPTLARLQGTSFSITGYMMLIEPKSTSSHFMITRRSVGCPFCPPNEPTEAMEVFATAPVAYTQAPITVEGRLSLIGESSQGLFYRLDKAKVG